jgi:hypothetical protein
MKHPKTTTHHPQHPSKTAFSITATPLHANTAVPKLISPGISHLANHRAVSNTGILHTLLSSLHSKSASSISAAAHKICLGSIPPSNLGAPLLRQQLHMQATTPRAQSHHATPRANRACSLEGVMSQVQLRHWVVCSLTTTAAACRNIACRRLFVYAMPCHARRRLILEDRQAGDKLEGGMGGMLFSGGRGACLLHFPWIGTFTFIHLLSSLHLHFSVSIFTITR